MSCRFSVAAMALVAGLGPAAPAEAASAVSCGGAAMQGGAQLVCSHVDPEAPPQLCTFSWALITDANVIDTVTGSFLDPAGLGQRPGLSGRRFRRRRDAADRDVPGAQGGSIAMARCHRVVKGDGKGLPCAAAAGSAV